MRTPNVFRLAACLLALTVVPASAALIDCAKPSLFVVARQVCDDPALAEEVKTAGKAFSETARHLSSRERSLLVSAERFWHMKLFDCANVDRATGAYRDRERCVPEVLDAHAAYLRQAGREPRSIVEHLADFDLIDARYLAQEARHYVGRSVRVTGAVQMNACRQSQSTPAFGRLKDGAASVPIRFDGLSTGQWSFLCDKQPFSTWDGVVRAHQRGYVLVADDVLGEPLTRPAN